MLSEYNPPLEPYLDIIYADEHLIVVNKPSGLLSVAGNKEQFFDSIQTRVREKFGFAEAVNRLDMATSGLMLLALSKKAERELKRQFREREVYKSYLALVYGTMFSVGAKGLIDLPLICDWENRPRQKICFENGKKSQTKFKVLEIYKNNTSLVKLEPITGRSHQLRLHCNALGFPIVGDKFYAPKFVYNLKDRLCLHSQKLKIIHPKTKEALSFNAPIKF